jgi:hypothetical protein
MKKELLKTGKKANHEKERRTKRTERKRKRRGREYFTFLSSLLLTLI